MFTGIIEEVGYISKIEKKDKGSRIVVIASKVLEDIQLGDSISTNGVCLTVTSFTRNTFAADVMPETISRTNFNDLATGSRVNLERAMLVGSRFGGHIVSGHIDGLGKISNITKDDNAVWITVQAEDDVLKYIIEKGSIAIDGISLTVAYVDDRVFKVSIIPMTGNETTLLEKNIGNSVNLECDMIGKYVEKLITFNPKKKDITIDFLRDNGFM